MHACGSLGAESASCQVGSLVRCICFETITSIVLLQRTEGVLSDALVDKLVIQLLKQSVDKLDTVREQAARQLGRLSVVRKVVPESVKRKHHDC